MHGTHGPDPKYAAQLLDPTPERKLQACLCLQSSVRVFITYNEDIIGVYGFTLKGNEKVEFVMVISNRFNRCAIH